MEKSKNNNFSKVNMKIFKKILFNSFKYFIMSIFLIISFVNFVFAASTDQGVKRVISVVYDDSYSMTASAEYPTKQDDLYAKYALENVIGFMNDNDELNIVRMSEKTKQQKYDVNGRDNKIKGIKTVDTWVSKANETPFTAVETAIEYLKDSKGLNGKNDSIEYWLLVLTDGDFEGKPIDKSIEDYFNDVRLDMSDVKYESVWVFIGSKINKSFSESINKVQGSTVLFSDNNEKICDAVYEACSVIYGRPTIKQSNFVSSNGNRTITMSSDFPVKKLMVYAQDQDLELENMTVAGGKVYNDFGSIEVKKIREPAIKSTIIEKNNNDILPAGEIVLNFKTPIDTSENKFMIMIDYALELQLGVLNARNEFELVPTSYYRENDNVNFAAKVINSYDQKEVDLTKYIQGVNSTYTFEDKTGSMTFDGKDKCFKFFSPVKIGSNVFSAIVSSKGQFRLKSNIVDIYVPAIQPIDAKIVGDDINVTRKLGDYEKVGAKEINFSGFNNEEKIKLEFDNIPKGIQVKANGTTVKNNNIELRVSGDKAVKLEVFRNKDYLEEERSQVDVSINFDNSETNEKLTTHKLSFDINPMVRVLKLDANAASGVNLDTLDSDNAFNKNILEIIPTVDGKNMSLDELKKSKITFKTNPSKIKSKISYKIEEIDGKNGIYVYFKPDLNIYSRGEEFTFDVNVKTPFGEEVNSTNHKIRIKNNLLGAIIKTIIFLFIVWAIIGIIKKPRFDKQQYKIIVAEDGAEKANEIIRASGGLSSLIPYKPQVGVAYDLNVKAGTSKTNIVVLKESLRDGMIYDGVEVPLDRDLKLYEDTPLVINTGRSKTVYTYTKSETGVNVPSGRGKSLGSTSRRESTGSSTGRRTARRESSSSMNAGTTEDNSADTSSRRRRR